MGAQGRPRTPRAPSCAGAQHCEGQAPRALASRAGPRPRGSAESPWEKPRAPGFALLICRWGARDGSGDAGGGSSSQLLASTLCPALAWHSPVFILRDQQGRVSLHGVSRQAGAGGTRSQASGVRALDRPGPQAAGHGKPAPLLSAGTSQNRPAVGPVRCLQTGLVGFSWFYSKDGQPGRGSPAACASSPRQARAERGVGEGQAHHSPRSLRCWLWLGGLGAGPTWRRTHGGEGQTLSTGLWGAGREHGKHPLHGW